MLHLIGEEEVNYIFESGDSIEGIARRAIKTYRNRPGFFTPYRDGYEFAGELIAPIVYPLAGAVTCVYAAFAAVAAMAACIAGFLVASGAALFCAAELRDDALEFSGLALQFAGIALFTSAVSVLLAIISFPHSVASLVPRSAATLFSNKPVAMEKEQDGPDYAERLREYNGAFECV
ncbi:MAG: hypothetical protein ACRCXC_06695 [Legionella sp.]